MCFRYWLSSHTVVRFAFVYFSTFMAFNFSSAAAYDIPVVDRTETSLSTIVGPKQPLAVREEPNGFRRRGLEKSVLAFKKKVHDELLSRNRRLKSELAEQTYSCHQTDVH